MMRRMVRLTLVFAVSAIVIGHAPGAWACSCAGGMSQEDYRKQSAAAFVGVPLERHESERNDTQPYDAAVVEYVFDVEQTLKGDLDRKVRATSSDHGATCGFTFTVGHRYRVYLYESEDGTYATGLCSGNQDLGPVERTAQPVSSASPAGSRPATGATQAPTPAGSPTATPTSTRTVSGQAGGAPIDPDDGSPVDGDGSGALVLGLGLVALTTAAGALVLTRRRRVTDRL